MSNGSVLVWRPGPRISTADVSEGLEAALRVHGLHVDVYDTGLHAIIAKNDLKWLEEQAEGITTNDADHLYWSSSKLPTDACRSRRLHGTEWIVCVSGMYQHPDYFTFLRDSGFRVALVLTESPYDLEYECRVASRVDCVFTNERTSVAALQAHNPYTGYLPAAWHHQIHGMAGLLPDAAAHDVVFVGSFFEERIKFLASIDWSGIDLGLYGGTDELLKFSEATGDQADVAAASRTLLPYVRGGYLPNQLASALYRRAKVNLNFFRTSKGFGVGVEHITLPAESMNPRCYELAALGTFFASTPRATLAEQLPMVPTFATAEECGDVVRRALADPDWRHRVAREAQAAVVSDSWLHRAATLLEALVACPRSEVTV